MAIAAHIKPVAPTDLAAEALSHSVKMPDLVIEAQRIANSLTTGWHGRRRRGTGDDFWQFRPYVSGEPASHIDWRRSARDNHVYIRDREWETAQTVWILTDQSPSMHYQSRFSDMSKDNRAILLALTLSELFARSGERIAAPGLLAPTSSRNACELLALALQQAKDNDTLCGVHEIKQFSHLIIISDFLDEPDEIMRRFSILSEKRINAYFIEICDPAEERFPYSGRTEFIDPETGTVFIAGKAQQYHDNYRRLYYARRQALSAFAARHGWSYHTSPTNRPLTEIILGLADIIGSASGYRRF